MENKILYGDGLHDDTEKLQSMLDLRGIVILDKPGVYLISKTLIIRSNTRFILSPGAHLLAAPYSKCALIENEAFASDGKHRDENISIEGGIFDGNCDNMGLEGVYEAEHRLDHPYSPSLFKGKAIRFAHIDRLCLEKMTVKDPVSYGIQIADAEFFVVRDIFFDYNHRFGTTDGVHINGRSVNGVIENLSGTTNDDMIGMTTIDEPHAEVSVGEISNISIRNITANNGYSGIRLLSAGGFPMKHIHISGVYGTYRHNAVLISHHYTRPNTPIWFDDIVVEKVSSSKSTTPLSGDKFTYWEGDNDALPVIWIEEGIHAGKIVLRDIYREEYSKNSTSYLLQVDKGAVIDSLTVENLSQKNCEGVSAPVYYNEATVNELIEKNVQK